jgi:amino acid transporter
MPVIFIFTGDFKSILAVDMLFYSLSLLLEISALIYLRVKAPNLQSSWKIPLDVTGLAAMFTPTILICLYVIFSASLKDLIVAVVILAVCILLLLGGYLLKGSNPGLFHASQDVKHVEKLDGAAA